MVDFNALLSKDTTAIKRPPILPAGTYYGIIDKLTYGESREKHTPFVEYNVVITGPGADVDRELLGDMDPTKKRFAGVSNRGGTFYLSDDSQFRLKEFCKGFGVNVDGITLRELCEIPQGKQVMVTITQTGSNRPGDNEMYNNLDRMVAHAG